MNATMDASTWSYGIGSASKTFIFSNQTHHKWFYDFCVYPADVASVISTETLQFSNSEDAVDLYPQRRIIYTNDTYYNNTLTTKVLYLLPFANGVTSNYQVVNLGGQSISGVYIKMERLIGGNMTKITDGYTDDAGTITFFLNPNYEHTLTVSKTGYVTQTQVIRPSQGTYMITLASTSSFLNYTSKIEGITYAKWPPSGLIQNGMYNFTLKVDSRNYNIYNCSFNIRRANGTIIGSAFGCNASYPAMGKGGKISVMVNVTGVGRLKGDYYVTITNGSIYMIEGDARWSNVNINSSGLGISAALNESLYLPDWGGQCPDGYTLNNTDLYCYADDGSGDKEWNQTADFSRIVFFFIFIAIALAILNFFTGYDTAYPGAFIYIITGIVFLMSAFNGPAGPGWFYLAGATNAGFFCNETGSSCTFAMFMDNWILFFHFLLLTAIYFFTTNKRYQSG